jgi:hypothetical protein
MKLNEGFSTLTVKRTETRTTSYPVTSTTPGGYANGLRNGDTILRASIVFIDDKFSRVNFGFTIDGANRDHVSFVAAVDAKIAQIEQRIAVAKAAEAERKQRLTFQEHFTRTVLATSSFN